MAADERVDLLDPWARLCQLAGIELSYQDNSGNIRTVSREAQLLLLKAMGFACDTLADVKEEVARLERRPWIDLVEPVIARTGTETFQGWEVYLPLAGDKPVQGSRLTWEICSETGASQHFFISGKNLVPQEIRQFSRSRYGRFTLSLPVKLEPGYYQLQVRFEASKFWHQGQSLLIIAPDQVYQPPILATRRLWGLNLPLYACRSRANWGLGDWGDVQRLVAAAAPQALGVIGLNPLHHLGSHLEDSISPYYPTSRTFLNPLYLDLPGAAVDLGFPELAAEFAALVQGDPIRSLQDQEQVDYLGVAKLKTAALEKLWQVFLAREGHPDRPQGRWGQEFAAFLNQEGDIIKCFGTFLALNEFWRQQGQDYRRWQQWPRPYQDPWSPTVFAFTQQYEEEILGHCFAQWLSVRQLQQTAAQARQAGLPLGLYLDLAVGVNPGGFDTWAHQGLFAMGVTVGAPPDDFSPQGQNWQLPPLLPQCLRTSRYQYFIRVLQSNCPAEGALRLDHVMGLFRLFWIPQGLPPAAGTYVTYPAAELLKIVALESHRRRTLIIGEDLGTVSPQIRQDLAQSRIMSTRLFYFERRADGSFIPPASYPEWTLAAITTHDLPTLAGFWQGRDITLRQELGLFPDEAVVTKAWEDRHQAKAAILELLRATGHLPQESSELLAAPDLPPAVKCGIISLLMDSPCRLLLLQLEDIFAWPEQQNLPGTKDEYPNWRLKLPLFLEEILEHDFIKHLGVLAASKRGLSD